jgi:hypothetical protein
VRGLARPSMVQFKAAEPNTLSMNCLSPSRGRRGRSFVANTRQSPGPSQNGDGFLFQGCRARGRPAGAEPRRPAQLGGVRREIAQNFSRAWFQSEKPLFKLKIAHDTFSPNAGLRRGSCQRASGSGNYRLALDAASAAASPAMGLLSGGRSVWMSNARRPPWMPAQVRLAKPRPVWHCLWPVRRSTNRARGYQP